MRDAAKNADELELDLPALDGDDEVEPDERLERLDDEDPDADPLDDATGEEEALDDLPGSEPESGWLVDDDASSELDLGAIELSPEPEARLLGDDDDAGAGFEDGALGEDAAPVDDAGEEGPEGDDDELRDDELPPLDADGEGSLPEEADVESLALVAAEELLWVDRAWARAHDGLDGADEPDESGALASPGEDPAFAPRDVVWRRLEQSGRAMVAVLLPGGSVVVAVSSLDRARAQLVRVQPDGEARILAEVEPAASGDDDGAPCVVTFLRWDAARGCLWVGGTFGVQGYRPC